jgi:ribosome-binding protein aMBF1 (putative translation factor)
MDGEVFRRTMPCQEHIRQVSYAVDVGTLAFLLWMAHTQSALSDAFSLVVRKHRERKGISRAALARMAGLHQTYIGLLERAERSPNLDTAKAIAASLGLSLAKMISEAERLARRR